MEYFFYFFYSTMKYISYQVAGRISLLLQVCMREVVYEVTRLHIILRVRGIFCSPILMMIAQKSQ